MSKRHKLIDSAQFSSEKQPKTCHDTNWDLCVLCQSATPESLQCPARSTRTTVGSGYTSLAKDLLELKELGHSFTELPLERLDDGSGIEATLLTNNAKWHKTCRLKYNQTAIQRIRKSSERQPQPHSSKVHTRSDHGHGSTEESKCFFCNKPAGCDVLHEASTKQLDFNVRTAALKLEDTELLAKLSAGDMIALEAKYHRNCLRMLYNKSRQKTMERGDNENSRLHGIAFGELVAFLEDARNDNCAPVFKLADLGKIYKNRLQQLGLTLDHRVHTSELKERLLAAIPDLRANLKGRDILLTFEDDIGDAIAKACDYDSEAMYLVRTAQVVRKEMFQTEFSFDGSFHDGCQKDSVPPTLLALVKMILDGANIKHQTELTDTATTTSALAISQLLVFNSVKHARSTKSSQTVRHSRDRERPLPLYVALKTHGLTRKRELVDTLHSLGMCVSYDRLLQVSTDIANGVCQQFEVENVVCPPKLRKGLFTTAAVDNVDHNPSSGTAKDSFHGTSISLIQHTTEEQTGTERNVIVIDQSKPSSRSISPLPHVYTNVPPVTLQSKQFTIPAVSGSLRPRDLIVSTKARSEEHTWLETVMKSMESEDLQQTSWISWSAYHADIEQKVIPPAAIIALLPLFLDQANTPAMIKHSMDIVKAAVDHLNPGQIPIIAADQPLYALAKQIQWTWPSTHGEGCFVIMFGGLHIEMAVLKLLGDWLEDSGWTSALVQAGVASTGTAESLVRASHVTKTRHAHQVTAASLFKLLHQAYEEQCASENSSVPFDDWCTKRASESVHFDYWLKTLSLEILMLMYIRSLREGNFQLYVETLDKILPWMFGLDHTHYSRWLSVHVRDMLTLQDTHPSISEEFHAGKFVVHKTQRKFSAIALDHCHEQNNATIKGSGGAVGLTENPGALRRWMIAGPEIARLIAEFEHTNSSSEQKGHHEQQPAVQKTFLNHVQALTSAIDEMGNPFLEESQDLLVLDTKDIMDAKVAQTVRTLENIGTEQYQHFVRDRLERRTKQITDTLPKNKLPLFSHPPAKTMSKHKEQLQTLKTDCSLFSRLYVSCQTREGDLDQFFSHENQTSPPSLSLRGNIRMGTKADLLDCLKVQGSGAQPPSVFDVALLDGAAVVQMLNPGASKTFQDYADLVFIPYVKSQLEKSSRLDIVWDVYLPESLKRKTRQARGGGTRRRVTPTTVLPKQWKNFLNVDSNKTELFRFLAQQVNGLQVDSGKEVFVTCDSLVLSSSAQADLSRLSPCHQEEADTRLFLHMADAVRKGHKKVMLRTVDTDVVVLAVHMFGKIEPEELWIGFGTGTNFRHIAVHDVVKNLDPSVCDALPLFHAFTGCDTVSAFAGRGKKTAWQTWKAFPDVTRAFLDLMRLSPEENDMAMGLIERFVILMYERTSEILNVNEARKQLFTQKSRNLENIPPTKDALRQHVKRAVHQAKSWTKSLETNPDLPSPSEWGWIKDATGWQPLWTTLPDASQSCYELIHCGCKKGCTGRCKCKKAALKCTALCSCSGDC